MSNTMEDERLKILQMIQEGKINAVEGLELLKVLGEADDTAESRSSSANYSNLAGRFLRVRVNTEEGKQKVNINLPLNLLKVASKFTKFIPESARVEMNNKGIDLNQIDFEELIEQINRGLVDGKIVDIEADDPKEGRVKVEVYVE